jgi:hypothetical protein
MGEFLRLSRDQRRTAGARRRRAADARRSEAALDASGVSFEFTRLDEANHRLEAAVTLPLGLAVREDLDCVPIDAERCRVNYHCHFGFPAGWRGAIVRRLLSRELEAGPADSLSRLKQAAEQMHRESPAVNRRRALNDGQRDVSRREPSV